MSGATFLMLHMMDKYNKEKMKIDPNPQIHVEINIWNLKGINLNRLKGINTNDSYLH